LGGRNLLLREIFGCLGRIAGIRPPRLKVMPGLVMPIAAASEWMADHVTGRPPAVPADAIRMARKRMFFDPGKAIRELGLPQSPVEDALGRAVQWFRTNGYAPA
jgi:dihydroflavonol-4-reductase